MFWPKVEINSDVISKFTYQFKDTPASQAAVHSALICWFRYLIVNANNCMSQVSDSGLFKGRCETIINGAANSTVKVMKDLVPEIHEASKNIRDADTEDREERIKSQFKRYLQGDEYKSMNKALAESDALRVRHSFINSTYS